MKSDPAGLVFLDSNIFIYAEAREEDQYQEARSLRDRALEGEFDACISPQVLSELFSSVTHQGRKGPEQPLSPSKAAERVRRYYESEDITLICPGPQTIGLMLSLLKVHPVSGARIHDLRIAATMIENGVTRIVTYDEHVFAHLPGITVVDPSAFIDDVKSYRWSSPVGSSWAEEPQHQRAARDMFWKSRRKSP